MSEATVTTVRREPVPLNGVDTPNLLATINVVKGAPELAAFQFRATNQWVTGTHSRTVIESFRGAGSDHTRACTFAYDADHPTVLVGADAGVEICGRLLGIDGDRVTFADDLVATTAASDIKLAGLLRRLDQFIERERSESDWVSPPPFQPTWTRFVSARRRLGLQAARVRSVIWASGFRRAYPWLRVGRALDGRGEIAHDAGVTAVPGLYALGLQFLRRRNSSFIDGVGRDASELADHLARYLRSCRRVA